MSQEAESRGAAEQRRKDAEGDEAVHQWRPAKGMSWHDCTKKQQEAEASLGYETRTLYTRPANVTALEARVKELEDQEQKDAQVIHWLAEKLKDADPRAKTDYELIARAALTRDGGV